jgi:Ca-activated chloride channel family protein
MAGYIDGSRPAPVGVRVDAAWSRGVAVPGGEEALLIRVGAPADPPKGRRTPTDVAFVLDRSGSMAGEKIDLVKQAVDIACGLLREEDRAALVVFDNEIDLLQPLANATPRTKTAIRMALPGVDARGGTNLSGGWLLGCRELATALDRPGAGTRTRRAILLTDGRANDGVVDPRELGRQANELRRRGIATTTVGVGLGFDEFLLSAMAEAGGGNFFYGERPEQLRGFFETELRELLRTVAIGLTVTLTLSEGVHAQPVSRFPAQRDGRTWTVNLGDVPAGDELDLVFRLTVRSGRIGDDVPVSLAATWTDPMADARRGGPVELPPLALGDEAAVERAIPNARALEAFALQTAANLRREALELDRAGRIDESRARLRSAHANLAAAPTSPRAAAYAQDIDALADAAGPYDEATRKRAIWEDERRRKGRDRGPAGTIGSSESTAPSKR